MAQSQKTRRGTVIVERVQGILLTETSRGMILLPGGKSEKGESRFEAAVRELREETGLIAVCALALFEHESRANFHRVVWMRAVGEPRPLDDAVALHYCTQHTKLEKAFPHMSPATREILEQFWAYKQQNQAVFGVLEAVQQ